MRRGRPERTEEGDEDGAELLELEVELEGFVEVEELRVEEEEARVVLVEVAAALPVPGRHWKYQSFSFVHVVPDTHVYGGVSVQSTAQGGEHTVAPVQLIPPPESR